jgi:hypothetical protein
VGGISVILISLGGTPVICRIIKDLFLLLNQLFNLFVNKSIKNLNVASFFLKGTIKIIILSFFSFLTKSSLFYNS